MRRGLIVFLMGAFLFMPSAMAGAGDFLNLDDVLATRRVESLQAVSDAAPDGSALLAWGRESPAKFWVVEACLANAASRLEITLKGQAVAAPVIAPDGRRAYSLSQDGWLEGFHLQSGRKIGEIRLGRKARSLALSGDGAWLMAALAEPGAIVPVKTEDFTPYRIIPARDEKGNVSEASFVLAISKRSSFVAALPGIKEIWELSHDPNAEPVYSGMVHSFEKGLEEAVGEEQPFARRRTRADTAWDRILLAPGAFEVLANAHDKAGGAVYNLDARRLGGRLPAAEVFNLANALQSERTGQVFVLSEGAGIGSLLVLDAREWNPAKRVPLPAPAQHMAIQPGSGEIWLTGFPDLGRVLKINPQSGAVSNMRLAAESVLGPLAFSSDGKTVYIGMGAALVTLDADTLTPKGRVALGASIDSLTVSFSSAFATGVCP